MACAGAESVLVHLSEGRDGYVQIAQGKLQEHDGDGTNGESHVVVSACIYLEVHDLLCTCTSRSSSNSGEQEEGRPAF